MTYRTILVDLTADGPVEARLDVARFLASRFKCGAHRCACDAGAARLAPDWKEEEGFLI